MKTGDTLRHHGILQTFMEGHILDTQEVNFDNSYVISLYSDKIHILIGK